MIIALFRLVASLHVGKKFIFVMEEPENSLHPKAQRQQNILASGFDKAKHGKERLNDFARVMYEKGAGSAKDYLKRWLGSTGTKLMKEKDIPVPRELKEIFDEVVEIVENGF